MGADGEGWGSKGRGPFLHTQSSRWNLPELLCRHS